MPCSFQSCQKYPLDNVHPRFNLFHFFPILRHFLTDPDKHLPIQTKPTKKMSWRMRHLKEQKSDLGSKLKRAQQLPLKSEERVSLRKKERDSSLVLVEYSYGEGIGKAGLGFGLKSQWKRKRERKKQEMNKECVVLKEKTILIWPKTWWFDIWCWLNKVKGHFIECVRRQMLRIIGGCFWFIVR